MRKLHLLGTCLIFLIFLGVPAGGTYIKDGAIVLIRSQFRERNITIDGVIDEEAWSRAGSITLGTSVNGTPTSITLRFTNDEVFFYISLEMSKNSNENGLIGFYFDTDGDGVLSTPEDAKIIIYNGSAASYVDSYWDGTNWRADSSQPTQDEEFLADFGNTAIRTVELKIQLVSSNVIYDGFRISNPSNSFLGFNFVSQEDYPQDSFLVQYPTSATNASGFVDLKLAGPEDQDLPDFIPPITQTISDIGEDLEREATLAQDALANFPWFFSIIAISVVALIIKKRRI